MGGTFLSSSSINPTRDTTLEPSHIHSLNQALVNTATYGPLSTSVMSSEPWYEPTAQELIIFAVLLGAFFLFLEVFFDRERGNRLAASSKAAYKELKGGFDK